MSISMQPNGGIHSCTTISHVHIIQYQGLICVIFSSHLNTSFTRATGGLFVGCSDVVVVSVSVWNYKINSQNMSVIMMKLGLWCHNLENLHSLTMPT